MIHHIPTVSLPQLKINKGVEMVMNLDIDDNDLITSLNQKQRLKNEIDSNPEIILKRRGKSLSPSFTIKEEGKEECESPMKDFNQNSINKFVASNNEKKMETEIKVLKKELKDMSLLREKIQTNLQNMLDQLHDFGMDLEVIDVNTRMIEQRFETEVMNSPKRNKKTIISKSDLFLQKTLFAKEITAKTERKTQLNNMKEKLHNDYLSIRKKFSALQDRITKKKKRLNVCVKDLTVYYHQLLYGGIDHRTEGLVWLIKAIWSLNQNVEMSFLPTFLDKQSIDYIFSLAHKTIEISKLKIEIEKMKSSFFLQCHTTIRRLELNDKTHQLFTTSIKRENNKNDSQIKQNNLNGNLKDLSKFFKEKSKDQIDYFSLPAFKEIGTLADKIEYLEIDLKKRRRIEMTRIFHEFIMNDYQRKHDVEIEVLIGALVGELGKDKELVNYYKTKRSYLDNMRSIEYYNICAKPKIKFETYFT